MHFLDCTLHWHRLSAVGGKPKPGLSPPLAQVCVGAPMGAGQLHCPLIAANTKQREFCHLKKHSHVTAEYAQLTEKQSAGLHGGGCRRIGSHLRLPASRQRRLLLLCCRSCLLLLRRRLLRL